MHIFTISTVNVEIIIATCDNNLQYFFFKSAHNHEDTVHRYLFMRIRIHFHTEQCNFYGKI